MIIILMFSFCGVYAIGDRLELLSLRTIGLFGVIISILAFLADGGLI